MAQESWKREEETGCQPPEGPIPCTNNCGFFGSVATMNLCSKCYRELIILKQSPVIDMSSLKGLHQVEAVKTPHVDSSLKGESGLVEIPMVEAKAVEALPLPLPSSPAAAAVASVQQDASSSSTKVTNRCFACRKRVGLTGFKCRCGDTFCSLHRYSDKHECKFDYKAAAREAIAKANPVVKADKIEKI